MDGFITRSFFSKFDLYQTPEEQLKRFAKYLNLSTDGYSHRQRARLVYWLLTRRHANPYATNYG